jgi:hypothetical protein
LQQGVYAPPSGNAQPWWALRVCWRACTVPPGFEAVFTRRAGGVCVVEADCTTGAGLLPSWIGVALVLWTGANGRIARCRVDPVLNVFDLVVLYRWGWRVIRCRVVGVLLGQCHTARAHQRSRGNSYESPVHRELPKKVRP